MEDSGNGSRDVVFHTLARCSRGRQHFQKGVGQPAEARALCGGDEGALKQTRVLLKVPASERGEVMVWRLCVGSAQLYATRARMVFDRCVRCAP